MSCLYFYKLESQYTCDETIGCLTKEQIDSNFYSLKGDDIKEIKYNNDTMVISVIRNDGNIIEIDISAIKEDYIQAIEEAVSGYTPSTTEINLSGSLGDEGTLTLNWTDGSGEHSTEINGFITEVNIYHDETLKGQGTKTNPLGIKELERTGNYKSVNGIVDNLPENPLIGDKFVTKINISSFGRLYTRNGMELVKQAIEEEESLWRIPTKEDWDKLLTYADVCDEEVEGEGIGEYIGDLCGKMLKSVDYWDGNENIDEYGFTAYPAGYVSDGLLEGEGKESRFWTDTDYEEGIKYIKGFSYNRDNSLQDAEKENEMYSIRLVRDIDSTIISYPNILGWRYDVISLTDIGQAWISTNLNHYIDGIDSEQYEYQYQGLITEKYTINYFNGTTWETIPLEHGDKFTVKEDNIVTEYVCVENSSGKQNLVKGCVYKVEGENKLLVLDAGWY